MSPWLPEPKPFPAAVFGNELHTSSLESQRDCFDLALAQVFAAPLERLDNNEGQADATREFLRCPVQKAASSPALCW